MTADPALPPLPPPGARPFDFVALGEASLDTLAFVDSWPDAGAKVRAGAFETRAGGQAATAALACAAQGWRVRYAGAVGDPGAAGIVLDGLAAGGVDVCAAPRPGVPPRRAFVAVERAGGRRTIVAHRDPRLALGAGEIGRDIVTSGRVLLVDATDPAASAEAARAAREAGIPTLVDADTPGPGVGALLDLIDVVVVSESFLRDWGGAGRAAAEADRLRGLAEATGASAAVVTLGARGALAWAAGRLIEAPAFGVPVVDTTGAGDAFRGGFVAAWLAAGPDARLDTLLEHANATAALSCRRLGAQAALPDRAEVEAHVTRARRA